ncbi:cellulase family glycosylhydrolase [Thermoanaerobacterium sp. R66]|nr:cellulase family glycosylhydrolase [Thermoanaerobacterium sp. R66]
MISLPTLQKKYWKGDEVLNKWHINKWYFFVGTLVIFAIIISLILKNTSLTFGSYDREKFPHLIGNSMVKKPSLAGRLKIIEIGGRKTLGDQHGNPIQLRGMSTHGLQWFPQIINNNAFSALSKDWEANVIRLAMYVGEGGYSTDPSVKEKVIEGINLAIKNDMYVIVDWHVLNPGDPNAKIYSGAKEFFKEIASKYPNDLHIIYELANEPNPTESDITNDITGWEKVKKYAEPIIKMLRDMGNENIIIVGSPEWSTRPDLAVNDPINDKNVMYSAHFYTGSASVWENGNKGHIARNIEKALGNGLAVFVTEWGTSEASGDGGPYLNEADEWLEFLNSNNISWVNWSLANKNEASAAFLPTTSLDPGNGKVWAVNQLSLSGEYVRARIKGISYKPISRETMGK